MQAGDNVLLQAATGRAPKENAPLVQVLQSKDDLRRVKLSPVDAQPAVGANVKPQVAAVHKRHAEVQALLVLKRACQLHSKLRLQKAASTPARMERKPSAVEDGGSTAGAH